MQHLKECAADAFGKDTEASRKWFDRHRKILLDDTKGIGRTIEAIRCVLGRGLEFFRSGCVESSNKFLVQQRWQQRTPGFGAPGELAEGRGCKSPETKEEPIHVSPRAVRRSP